MHVIQMAWRLMLAMLLLCLAPAGQAHQSGHSYLQVTGDQQGGLTVQLDISIKDINGLLEQAPAQQNEMRLAAILPMQAAMTAMIEKSLTLEIDGKALALAFEAQSVTLHNDERYLRQIFTAAGVTGKSDYLLVRVNFFSEEEKRAHTLFRLAINGSEYSSVFDARHTVQRFALRKVPVMATLLVFAREGALHIWSGPDHLLFLLCLLLPCLSLVSVSSSGLRAQLSLPLVFALKVVTAFTLAHSLTLLAATMDWIALPERWIEAAIAASIIIAATLNLTSHRKNHHWKFAFGFGLIHGMGFANGLRELGLSQTHFIETLLAFNLGVEFGQLVVVLAAGLLVLPFLQRPRFAAGMLHWGSALTISVAGVWLAQRLTG